MASSLQGKGVAAERFPADIVVPEWCAAADRFLIAAAKEIRLLSAVTPLNGREERERLSQAFEANETLAPRWTYATSNLGELGLALTRLADEIVSENSALAPLYAERAREMAVEAALVSNVGTSAFGKLAAHRFVESAALREQATRLAQRWIDAAEVAEVTDNAAPVPASLLLDEMRAAVGRLRLPFTVSSDPHMAALAATGEHTIYVSTVAVMTARDVERTVLHETLGHAAPRHRATSQPLGLFRIGTARGADHQEGYALLLEERHHLLDLPRKRELALRHLAAVAMEQGATFHDLVELLHDYDLGTVRSVAIASRIYRGSNGAERGLGRERSYLEAYVAVSDLLSREPDSESVLASGQIATEAVPVLREFISHRS